MSKKKIRNILIITIITIFFVVCFLVKYYKNNKQEDQEQISNIFNAYPLKNDDITISFELNDLLAQTNINLNENFENKSFKYPNKKLNYYITCIDYNDDYLKNGGKYSCRAVEMKVQYRLNRLFTYSNDCQRKIYMILYKGYVIEHTVGNCEVGCGTIKIYNNGELLTTINNANANPKLLNSKDYNYVKMYENNLYYFTDEGDYTILNKLNLNNLNNKEELAKIENKSFSCENKES